jgi:hypothetical protein
MSLQPKQPKKPNKVKTSKEDPLSELRKIPKSFYTENWIEGVFDKMPVSGWTIGYESYMQPIVKGKSRTHKEITRGVKVRQAELYLKAMPIISSVSWIKMDDINRNGGLFAKDVLAEMMVSVKWSPKVKYFEERETQKDLNVRVRGQLEHVFGNRNVIILNSAHEPDSNTSSFQMLIKNKALDDYVKQAGTGVFENEPLYIE